MNTHSDYLQKILTAAVYDVAVETPLDYAKNQKFECASILLIDKDKNFTDFPAAKDYTVKCPNANEFRAC
ncbi:MAG: hypothetical protein J6U05_03925, partial [Neisseriaceae bacterium]|nr:hypothetical protein [Neisseriaceae bacterium]